MTQQKPKAAQMPPPDAQNSASYNPPLTISGPDLLEGGSDAAFRSTLYLMVKTFGQLETCRDAFGRHVGLTGSQFAVLIGTAYTQAMEGVTIRDLAAHVQLASTHVTTEVGRLVRLGLLVKRPNERDGRSVLVKLSAKGEAKVADLSPYMRSINDTLFEGIGQRQFAEVDAFLRQFVSNGERALRQIADKKA